MKTKEAIEFLEKEKLVECGTAQQYKWTVSLRNLAREFEEVIELLQRSEKFEKMWGEMDKEYGMERLQDIFCDKQTLEIKYFIKDRMEQIKQKYFPKEKQ